MSLKYCLLGGLLFVISCQNPFTSETTRQSIDEEVASITVSNEEEEVVDSVAIQLEKEKQLLAEAKLAEAEAAAKEAVEKAKAEKKAAAKAERKAKREKARKEARAKARKEAREKARKEETERKKQEAEAASTGTVAKDEFNEKGGTVPTSYQTVTSRPVTTTQPIVQKKPFTRFQSTKYSFGVIEQGDIVKHKFKFTNLGNAPLQVLNVTATCGCAKPIFPKVPIEPGKSGEIEVTYDSKGKFSIQKPGITVFTNEDPGIHELVMEGRVNAELKVANPNPSPDEFKKDKKEEPASEEGSTPTSEEDNG